MFSNCFQVLNLPDKYSAIVRRGLCTTGGRRQWPGGEATGCRLWWFLWLLWRPFPCWWAGMPGAPPPAARWTSETSNGYGRCSWSTPAHWQPPQTNRARWSTVECDEVQVLCIKSTINKFQGKQSYYTDQQLPDVCRSIRLVHQVAAASCGVQRRGPCRAPGAKRPLPGAPLHSRP